MNENNRQPTIDVLLCTYKRVELLTQTLKGIEESARQFATVRVIVVDNDIHESARVLVESRPISSSMEIVYLTQPLQNISITRNVALEHAVADYIALIDDDEVPTLGWLTSLVSISERYDADVVFGPVEPKYASDVPQWAREGRFMTSRARHSTGNTIQVRDMRSGNVLLRGQRVYSDRPRFDPELGLSGGEDSEFFSKLHFAGYKNVWCDEAVVYEWVPASRGSVKWLTKRMFRIGSVESFNRRRRRQWKPLAYDLLRGAAFTCIGACLAAIWGISSKHRFVVALQKTAFGLGIFYGAVWGPYFEYKAPNREEASQ